MTAHEASRRRQRAVSQRLLPSIFPLLVILYAAWAPQTRAKEARILLRGGLQAAQKIGLSNIVQPPTEAGNYVDSFFADHEPGQSISNFTKRSRTAVVYMCYERGNIIAQSFAALLGSTGLQDFDLIVSQDGGSSYVLDIPPEVHALYVRHPVNLCTGLHHYWVKRFVFDVMGYEELIVVEEDNILHRQALQVLSKALQLSLTDSGVGLVSITDMDNSALVDTARYSTALLSPEVDLGHLWVYALHVSRYAAVRSYLHDYADVIKSYDYRTKDRPPLSTAIQELRKAKGMPFENVPLSQDAFLVASLAAQGYTRRLTTLLRLFEPIGWQGLHFRQDPSAFFGLYGKGMYDGPVEVEQLYDVTKDGVARAAMLEDCRQRLDALYLQILGRHVDEGAVQAAETRLLAGKLNAVELVRNMRLEAERQKRLARAAAAAA